MAKEQDTFQHEMSAALNPGKYMVKPRFPTSGRPFTAAIYEKRVVARREIPKYVEAGLPDEVVANTLELPGELVTRVVREGHLRPARPSSAESTHDNNISALLTLHTQEIIRLRGLNYTVKEISREIRVSFETTRMLIQRLIQAGLLAPRERKSYHGHYKLPMNRR